MTDAALTLHPRNIVSRIEQRIGVAHTTLNRNRKCAPKCPCTGSTGKQAERAFGDSAEGIPNRDATFRVGMEPLQHFMFIWQGRAVNKLIKSRDKQWIGAGGATNHHAIGPCQYGGDIVRGDKTTVEHDWQ